VHRLRRDTKAFRAVCLWHFTGNFAIMFQKRPRKRQIEMTDAPEEAAVVVGPKKRLKGEDTLEQPTLEIIAGDDISLPLYGDGGATLHPESLIPEDGRHKMHKRLEISRKIKSGEAKAGVYRGLNSYPIYAEKSERDITNAKFTGSLGPVKPPSHIRTSCRFDYAMGLCKDWAEAGYCGFGDGCIFVHDRSDVKTGWQLEKDWAEEQEHKRRRAFEGGNDSSEDLEVKLDSEETGKCGVCDNDPIEAVRTACQHLFCYRCALQHYGKSAKCKVCSKPTRGIFNSVTRQSK
jgi:RING finger protein 113A